MTTMMSNPQSAGQTVREQIMKMVPDHLKNDKAYLNLVRAIHTVAYMKGVRNTMKKYMEFRKVKSCEKLVHEKPRMIEEKITEFFEEMGKNVSNNTIHLYYSHLKTFCDQNDVKKTSIGQSCPED